MDLTCPACRSAIGIEDVNVSTDLALCRACGKSFQYSEIAGDFSQGVSLNSPPPGAWFQQLPDGFSVGATTRSWLAIFLIPFTCAWSGVSMYGIYVRQIVSHHFVFVESLVGLPFLFGTFWLVAWCAMTVAGRTIISLRSDRLAIFIGVGRLGWTRTYVWSDFRSIREDMAGNGLNWNRFGRVIVLEGARRVTFGSFWTEDRRYFVMSTIRRMLTNRSQASAIASPRFR